MKLPSFPSPGKVARSAGWGSARMADERARTLRKSMTPQEVRLWLRLRLLRPQGLHFRTQVPLHGLVVDFACLRAKLIVEVDGGQHGLPAGFARDRWRDTCLAAEGFKTLRFWNHEVDRTLDDVTETIYRAAIERLTPSGASRHLPL
jgi:very-short-patch-repair endonuclease